MAALWRLPTRLRAEKLINQRGTGLLAQCGCETKEDQLRLVLRARNCLLFCRERLFLKMKSLAEVESKWMSRRTVFKKVNTCN